MNDITWRSLKEHPGHFVLSILAVMLGVTFVTGTLCLGDILTSAYSDVMAVSSSADIYVQPENADPATDLTQDSNKPLISDELVSVISRLPEIGATTALYRGPVILLDADGKPVPAGYTPSIAIASDPNQIQGGEIVEGSLPTSNEEIALESSTAIRAGLAVGDDAQIIANGRVLNVTVTGIVRYETSLNGSVLVILDRVSAKVLYAPAGMVGSIAAKVSGKSTLEDALKAVEAALPANSSAIVLSGAQLRVEADKSIRNHLGFISAFLWISVAVALIVGGFLIVNTFATIVRRRAHQDAILKSIGVSSGQIFGSVVLHAIVVGAIGSILGVVVGYGLIFGVRQILVSYDIYLTDQVPVSLWVIAVSLFAGIITSIAAAAIPAFSGSRTATLEGLDTPQLQPEKAGWVRSLFGALLVLGGVAGLYFATVGDYPELYLAVGVIAVLIGIVAFATALVRPLMRILAWPFEILSRLSGTFGRQNVSRSPRRTVGAASPFILGLALISGLTILTSSASASALGNVNKELKVDFVVTSADAMQPFPQAAVDQVRQLPSTKVYVFGTPSVSVTLPVGATAPTLMYGPDSTFIDAMKVTIVDGSATEFATGAAISKKFAEANDLGVGDDLTLVLCPNTPFQANETVPITVIIDSQLLADVVLPASWLQKKIPAQIRQQSMQVTQVFLGATDPSLVQTLDKNLKGIAEGFITLKVQSADDFVNKETDNANLLMVALYVVVALTVIIAILGIVNNLSRSVSLSTREIGVLRAAGVSPGAIGRTVIIESVLIALFGSLFGILVGSSLAVVTQMVYASSGLGVLSIPWVQLPVMFVISGLVGVIGAFGAAGRASRVPVLSAIAYE